MNFSRWIAGGLVAIVLGLTQSNSFAALSEEAVDALFSLDGKKVYTVLEGFVEQDDDRITQNVIVVESKNCPQLETDIPIYHLRGSQSLKTLALVYGARGSLLVGLTVGGVVNGAVAGIAVGASSSFHAFGAGTTHMLFALAGAATGLVGGALTGAAYLIGDLRAGSYFDLQKPENKKNAAVFPIAKFSNQARAQSVNKELSEKLLSGKLQTKVDREIILIVDPVLASQVIQNMKDTGFQVIR